MRDQLPKLELLKVLQQDAAEVIAARDRALLIHSTRDIDAAGDEVEQVLRKVLRRKLASKYYIGHGHVLDNQLTTSPQLDIIIADNSGAPVLFQGENGTEYFPYEAVYAIGEIKSTYYKSKRYIHDYSDVITRVRSTLNRETTPLSHLPGNVRFTGFKMTGSRPYRNPLFSFMVFVNSNDFHPDHITDLYRSRSHSDLPNVICLLDEGIVLNITTGEKEDGSTAINVNVIPEFNKASGQHHSKWVFLPWGPEAYRAGANLGFLIFALSEHLKHCVLMEPNILTYLNSFFVTKGGWLIAESREQEEGP